MLGSFVATLAALPGLASLFIEAGEFRGRFGKNYSGSEGCTKFCKAGNSTGLVGTPDQVADAMLDYYDIGITTFLVRGFDPLVDAIQYGRELLPRVRALIEAHEAGQAVAAE